MCHHIADTWWGILNSFMAWGWSAFLWILQKNCRLGEAKTHRLTYLEARLINFIFVNVIQYPWILKNNIQHRNIEHLSKRRPPPFFHSGTNLVLGNALVHPFEKNPVLVVTVKLIWFLFLNILFFNFLQTPKQCTPSTFFKYQGNVHRSVVAQTNQCQDALLFLLDVRCPKCSHSFFCDCLPPTIVHLRNLFLLSTPAAQMLLTPRWVSRRKHVT